MKPNWFLRVGSFVVGVVVGTVVFRGRAEPKAASPVSEYANPAVVDAEPRLAPSPSPLRAASPPENAPLVGTRLRALVELNGCLRHRIPVPLVESDKINDDFVAVYEVSASEKALLEEAVAKAKNRMRELGAKFAVITPGTEDDFRILIPPFPEEGGILFDEFSRSVRAVLGEERYASYQENGEEADSSSFGGFGVGEAVIILRGPGTPSDRQYTIHDEGSPRGMVKSLVVVDRMMFLKQYPELARKMVAEGFWQMPVEP